MTTIVTRAGKGSPLTNNEVDANFTNLNTAKVEVTGTPLDGQVITWDSATNSWVAQVPAGGGTVTSVAASGGTTGLTFSGSPITSTGTLTLGGTLAIASGGTGGTTAADARTNLSAAVSGANNDITSMSAITGGIGSPDYIQFDTAAVTAPAVGQLNWNDTDGTLEFGMKGGNVVLQVGQEEVVRVTNATASGMVSGQAVYITGSTGNHLNVELAKADAELTSSKTLAVVTESISASQSGFATTSGLVRGLNTSALTEGAAIWLSASVAGGLTSTRPIAPNNAVLIGWCVRQHATVGVIYVHIANGYELDELHDVLLTGTADKDVLSFDSTSGLWKNRALATVANTGSYSDLTGKPTNVSSFTNDVGYITTTAVAAGYQPLDGDLTAIAALSDTSGLLKKTAADTWALDTSAYLTGNQSISVSGDATGSGSTSIALTLANSGVTAGTYTKVTVDAKGRVTTGASLASADLPTYTGTLTSSQVTTALGYTPYNSSNPSGYITSAALSPYAPLASPAFTGTASFTAVKSAVTAVAASAIDCATGNYFTKTATGALSWTVSNVPATGVFSFLLELTNGGTGTQTWFTGIKWPGGTAPTLTASGVDLLGFVTDDGGTTWRGVQLMKDSK